MKIKLTSYLAYGLLLIFALMTNAISSAVVKVEVLNDDVAGIQSQTVNAEKDPTMVFQSHPYLPTQTYPTIK